jgi:ketosteroid isomerase-like protein
MHNKSNPADRYAPADFFVVAATRRNTQMIGALIARRVIQTGFAALNRGDTDALMKHWHDECALFYPGRVKAGGKYEGKPQVRAWFEGFFAQFPHRKYTIKQVGLTNLFDLLGNNTIFVVFELELVNRNQMKATNSGVSMITIRWGKAVSEKIFLDTIDGDEYRQSWGDIP